MPVIGEDYRALRDVRVTITRPADTTTYTAKDTIADLTSGATILTFADAARDNGRGGFIHAASMQVDQVLNTDIYKLHLFSASPAVVLSDNAPMTAPLPADVAIYLGALTFPAAVQEQGLGDAYAQTEASSKPRIPMPYVCGSASTSLFGMLECVTGHTPDDSGVYTVRLVLEQV